MTFLAHHKTQRKTYSNEMKISKCSNIIIIFGIWYTMKVILRHSAKFCILGNRDVLFELIIQCSQCYNIWNKKSLRICLLVILWIFNKTTRIFHFSTIIRNISRKINLLKCWRFLSYWKWRFTTVFTMNAQFFVLIIKSFQSIHSIHSKHIHWSQHTVAVIRTFVFNLIDTLWYRQMVHWITQIKHTNVNKHKAKHVFIECHSSKWTYKHCVTCHWVV